MPVAEAAKLMTTEELLAMPDDGVERWLIRAQLREGPTTVRNRWHSRIMVRVGHVLEAWREQQPEPRGLILGGEAGVRLRKTPDSTVGIDVVYISAELAAQQTDETRLVDGVPVLAVEILSPIDTVENIVEKIDDYQQVGVPLVWVINPRHRTVEIFRSGRKPELVNETQELSGEPHLPGFCVPVAQIFE